MSKANHAQSTSSVDRRSILAAAGGLAAAGALAAVPGHVRGADVARLTPIQKLWPEYLAAAAECERLDVEQDLARERQLAMTPAVPEELGMSDFEVHYYGLRGHLRLYRRIGQGLDDDGFRWVTAEGWRAALARPPMPSESCPHHMMAGFRSYSRRMLGIAECYEASAKAAEIESGYATASAAWEAALEHKEQIAHEIMTTPAETIADLVVQAETAKARDCPEDDAPALIAAIRSFAASATA